MLSFSLKRRHINGLCILTAGNLVTNALLERNKALITSQNDNGSSTSLQQEPITVRTVQFQMETTDSQSVGGKRKRLKNGGSEGDMKEKTKGMVGPKDTIAVVELSNGETLDVKAFVRGSLLEVNTNLEKDPSLLCKDPLLDGFVAVIKPIGPYPPGDVHE